MRSNPRFRLFLNVLIGVLAGVLISQILSGCSNELPLAPPPGAGLAADTMTTTDAPLHEPIARINSSTDAVIPVPQTTERYHLSWDGKLEGDATRTLACQAQRCRYETHASVVGLASLSEISDFNWQHGQVDFQRYERSLQLLFKQTLRIEKQPDGRILSNRRGKLYDYDSQPGLVDILNIEVQLRADRLAGRAPKSSYALADSKGVSAISLRREANETLSIAGKSRPCEVYVREDGKRTTTLWLDPAQAFLPLQIVHQDGAETYRMVWLGD